MSQTNCKLGFVHVFVTEACNEHSSNSRKDNVKHKANVGPYIAHLRDLSDELPDSEILVVDTEKTRLGSTQSFVHIIGSD